MHIVCNYFIKWAEVSKCRFLRHVFNIRCGTELIFVTNAEVKLPEFWAFANEETYYRGSRSLFPELGGHVPMGRKSHEAGFSQFRSKCYVPP